MNTDSNDQFCPDLCERKEVVIIGNGPSAITLSYILSGHIPYWNGCPVSNDYLNIRLEQSAKDVSLLDQDLEYLSDGLEGRSKNPVALLIDNLLHPDADFGANLQSKIKWRYELSSSIDHVCLGRGGIGGVWNELTSKELKTVSMADWMELPNYSMNTFRRQRRARRNNQCSNSQQAEETTNNEFLKRATYDEVRSYYMCYVKRNHLTDNFRNGYEVTSIERARIDSPFYDESTNEICQPEPLWEIHGYKEVDKTPFVILAKHIVLATGIEQKLTRPIKFLGEQASQSFTYSTLNDIEELINKKKLRANSKPLLVVGCGLTAIDVIILCRLYSIPVLHVFRRSLDDQELVFNQLSANVYPEYERVKELMKQTISNPLSDSSYRCFPHSEIISITEDGTVHIRNLRTQTKLEYEISYVARLTGSDISVPLISSLTVKKNNGLQINPYTYECVDLENVYALGPLVGDKLVRFLQGGALACAANIFKKHRQTSSCNNKSINSSRRLSFSNSSRVKFVV